MRRKKRLIITGVLLLLGGALLFYLYAPHPIVKDLNTSRIDILFYNPNFNQVDNSASPLVLDNFDEKAVLDCLSRYAEHRTFRQGPKGFGQANMQFYIFLQTGNTSKSILLGNENYIDKGNGKAMYGILNADALRAELFEILAPDFERGHAFGEDPA